MTIERNFTWASWQESLEYFKCIASIKTEILSILESTCCSGGSKQPKPPKEKKPKKQKPKKSDSKDKPDEKAAEGAAGKEEKGKSSGKEKEKSGKPSPYQVN